MNRKWAGLLLVVVLALAACGGQNNGAPGNGSGNNQGNNWDAGRWDEARWQ